MSRTDYLFRKMCVDILENGFDTTGNKVRARWKDGDPAYTIKQFAVINRYNLAEEFPILTLREINFKAAIDEILWIWQKKSNNIKDLGSKIWNAWADENGSIGKAYGYQLAQKSIYPEGEFDQVDRMLWALRNDPYDRAMIADMFVHQDLHAMRLRPCAHHIQLDVANGKLNMLLKQRSQDVLVANNWNVMQYAILQHMFAIHAGLEVGELVHVITDCHIYNWHIPMIEELIERDGFEAPKLIINPEVKNFYDFKVEDFTLENYQHGAPIKGIPVAE